MNDKEKIIEVIRKRLTELSGSCQTDDIPLDEKSAEIVMGFACELADALIKKGIGNVAEWKLRAEIAERNDKIKKIALRIAGDQFINEVCNLRDMDTSDKCDYKCKSCFYDYYIQQAEREIEKERK